jgi:hypothetical protein
VARGLDRLEGAWLGSSPNPESFSEASAVTTARTVSVEVSFEATCTFPGSTEPSVRVGNVGVTLLRRQGSGFAFDVAANLRRGSEEEPWQGTVTGRISATAITLDVRATGTPAGYSCDTGPLTLTLARHAG